jgi:serine/threonine protein kinase
MTTVAKKVKLPSSARYKFLEPIGEGGAGVVYRATEVSTGQPVAIKVLAAKLSENLTLHRRLAVEFQAAQALEHPNIVRAIECQCDGDISYCVYELVEGESLGMRLDKCRKLPEAESIRIITQLIQALHYAHQRKIIHRYVKPDNIMLTAAGSAKLTDFGLAKDFNNATQDITRPATALGTPHFMAPEQFADAKTVDHRCDVYSVGATLYNALTGLLPFDAKAPYAILANKEAMKLATVRSLVPTVSYRVDEAIFAALDPKPRNRPADCYEFFRMMTARSKDDPPAAEDEPDYKGDERRAAQRFSLRVGRCVHVDPNLHGGDNEQWPLIVRDVSQTGIGILLARRFEPGTELAVEGAPGPNGRPELLPAHVVRVQPEQAGHWIHGCTFDKPLHPEQFRALLHMR